MKREHGMLSQNTASLSLSRAPANSGLAGGAAARASAEQTGDQLWTRGFLTTAAHSLCLSPLDRSRRRNSRLAGTRCGREVSGCKRGTREVPLSSDSLPLARERETARERERITCSQSESQCWRVITCSNPCSLLSSRAHLHQHLPPPLFLSSSLISISLSR